MKETRTFRLDKLVRDNIIDSKLRQGGEVASRTLTGEELKRALIAKVIEEAQELEQQGVSAGEIADIREAIGRLCAVAGISEEEVDRVQAEKRETSGGFINGDFIETVTLPTDNKWVEYYASQPERFPEVK